MAAASSPGEVTVTGVRECDLPTAASHRHGDAGDGEMGLPRSEVGCSWGRPGQAPPGRLQSGRPVGEDLRNDAGGLFFGRLPAAISIRSV
jgi:hypothetical protein